MDTDPRAHGNNPTLPTSPRRTHLRAHRHQSKSDVTERPHHSHPVNQAIKIATSTRLAPKEIGGRLTVSRGIVQHTSLCDFLV